MTFLYHPHEYGIGEQRMRVWRSDWSHDQFQIMASSDLTRLQGFCLTFGIPIHDVEDMDQEEIDALSAPKPSFTVVKQWGQHEIDVHGLFKTEELAQRWAIKESQETTGVYAIVEVEQV